MPRQEISSVFSDGLMMDLNPINTPKSVLTDCLNGTYITYNGNEFVLQNDMGNYKLKNCKLPTNFIPVGVKGYADILYIVSYNPFTKEVEIGSYPAPQSIFTTSNEENKVPSTDEELAPFNWPTEENTSDTRQYPELIKNDKKPLFIFAGSDEETYKLNPGDEFKLEGLNDIIGLEYIYQHLNFYVIDEDNKLYDLDDSDIYFYNGEKWNGDTMRKVFWETPGWLAAQYDLYVPDKFNLNLKSLNVPEFLIINDDNTSEQAEGEIDPKTQFEASMDLSSQVIITDLLFQNELNKWKVGNHYRDLYIRYKIETTSGTFHGFTTDSDITVVDNGDGSYDIPCKWHNYQDDVITAFVNCSPVWWMNNPKDKDNPQNYDGVIAITAYPIIKYNGKILEFTQFETKLRFPLNTLKNSNNITIADSIYKWSVDDDSCTISFNINGPFINASNITGRYEIYRINLFKNPPEQDWKPDTATSSLDNPESYSKWTGLSKTVNTKVEGVLEKLEGKDEEEFIERAINADIDDTNPNDFINQKKVLMCKGTLPNLVLYGQNTININWDSSNEYELTGYQNWYTNPDHTEEDGNKNWFVEDTSYVGYEDTTKTIDFSKEGGIYMFRVILEQGEQKLAESKQVLIPSEVFNDWFGSIDNYLDETNGITSSMWVGKWLDQLNYSIPVLNNLNVDLSLTLDDQNYDFITYSWGLGSKKPLNVILEDNKIDWDNTFLNIIKEQFGENYQELSSIKLENLTFYLDVNKLLNKDSSKVNIVINNNKLKGNLWNPIDTTIFNLKQNSQEIPLKIQSINNNNVILIDEIQNIVVTVSPNTTSSVRLLSSEYPFYKMFSSSYLTSSLTKVDFENTELTGGQFLNSGGSDYGRNIRWVTTFGNKVNKGSSNPAIITIADGTNDKGAGWDVNHNTFGFVGEILTQYNLSWARGRLFTTSNGNTWENTIVIDDESADKGNLGVLIDGVNKIGVTGLFFKASRGNSNKSKSVFVQFGPNEETRRMFCYGIMQLKIENYSSNPETIHIPTLSYSNLNTQETIGINKTDILVNLNLLKVDDVFLIFKNTIQNLKNIDSSILLSKDINNNLSKTIYNISIPSTVVSIDFSKNIKWTTFNNQLNSFINIVFNRSQQDRINTVSQRTGGSKLIYDTEAHNNDFPSWYNQFVFPTPNMTSYKDVLLKKFECYTPGGNINSNNIAFINESLKTVKLVNSPRDRNSSKAKDWSPKIIVCYYESLS